MPHEVWVKAQAVIPRLPELRQAIRTLEDRVKKLEAAQAARGKKKGQRGKGVKG
jgi:UDP-3-O-[3-hydroxymyristoyl] glucosamine N-acyltransferase